MILTGKSPGKPSHGCPFCSARTPYLENGDLYKLGDLISLHQVSQHKTRTKLIFRQKKPQKFVEDGSDAKKQQLYDNVTNPPLITSSVEKLVIESLSVPELHLLLGRINLIRNI